VIVAYLSICTCTYIPTHYPATTCKHTDTDTCTHTHEHECVYAHKHKNTPQFEMAVPQSASPVLMRIWGKQINDAIVLMRARTFIVDHHESAAARSCSGCMTHLHQVPKVIERCLGVLFHYRRRRVTHEPHQLSLFHLICHKHVSARINTCYISSASH